MPDHPRSDDELLSSYLDGELTDDAVALVERRVADEPVLQQRLDGIRSARALSATPVTPLSDAATGDLIAAALAAGSTAGSTAENVTDLTAASARRNRSWPTRLATVAAGVAALAITASVVGSLIANDDESLDAATSADSDDSGPDDANSGNTGAGEGDGDLSLESLTTTGDDGDGDADTAPASDMTDSADSDSTDDDSAGDDSADDESAAMPDGDDTEAEFAPEETRARADLRATLADGFSAGFEPMTPELGSFATMAALSDTLRDAWSQFADDPPTASTTSAAPVDQLNDAEVAAQVDERLDELGLRDCDALAEDVRAVLEIQFASTTIVAADFATAEVDGVAVTVAVFLLTDDQVAALVIDQATCTLLAQSLA